MTTLARTACSPRRLAGRSKYAVASHRRQWEVVERVASRLGGNLAALQHNRQPCRARLLLQPWVSAEPIYRVSEAAFCCAISDLPLACVQGQSVKGSLLARSKAFGWKAHPPDRDDAFGRLALV